MKKIISFSLWGNNPKYCVGAIKNSELREKYYPDWTCRFYVHKDVPNEYIESLRSADDTEVVIEDRAANWTGMFWRFEPISEEDVSVMISRDCDSRLNLREADAVSEFMDSEKLFHIMRDHPHHGFNVLGGMFGVKKGILDNMKDLCARFAQTDNYGTDYRFFDAIIGQIALEDIMVHDPFFTGIDFPNPREKNQFVGQVFDENNVYDQSHLDALNSHLNKSS